MDTLEQEVPVKRRSTAGRKKMPHDQKKHPITMKLPGWLLEWLEEQMNQTNTSRAVLIEQALVKTFKIKHD